MAKTRSRKRRKVPLESGTPVIYRALKEAGLTEMAQRLQIAHCWREAVGPVMAARTMPDTFRAGVLFVKVATPTWQQELSYLKADVITKLNKALGRSAVQDLKVVCGARLTPQQKATAVPPKNQPTPDKEDYEAAAVASASIACPTIRAAFEQLMAKDLWAKRQSRPPKAKAPQ